MSKIKVDLYTKQLYNEKYGKMYTKAYDILSGFKIIFVNIDTDLLFTLDEQNNNIVFYLNTPSVNSFFIFGGWYDTETWVLYSGFSKYKLCVQVLDLVAYINRFTGIKHSREEITSILLNFKLLGDVDQFIFLLNQTS